MAGDGDLSLKPSDASYSQSLLGGGVEICYSLSLAAPWDPRHSRRERKGEGFPKNVQLIGGPGTP